MTEPSDEMLEAFDRAFAHVPLSLYDEHLKPAQRALSDLLARLREVEGLQNDAELWLAQERAVRGLLAEAIERAEKAEARVRELEQALRNIAYMGALDGEFYDCRDCGGPERAAAALEARTL